MSLKNRVEKLEATTAKNVPEWMFVSHTDEGYSRVMSVMDINHVYEGSIQNDKELSTDEFLVLASDYFGVDLVKVHNSDDMEVMNIR